MLMQVTTGTAAAGWRGRGVMRDAIFTKKWDVALISGSIIARVKQPTI
jgi:hypothetical protein